MGKTKQKQKSEIEYLKGIINGLKKENKLLKAQLGKVDKLTEDKNDEYITENCQVCGKGDIVTLDLNFIKIHTCNVCGSTKKERYK